MHFKSLLAQSLLWRGLYFISILLVNIFLSRSLQADWTGWVYYISNIFSLIVLVFSFNLDAGIVYFSSSKKIDTGKLLWLGLSWCTLITLVAGIFFKYFIDLLPAHEMLTQTTLLIFSVLYISGVLFTNILTALFYSQRNFKLPNILLLSVNFSFLTYLFFHQHVSGYDLLHVLQFYFLCFLLQGFILVIIFFFQNKNVLKFSFPSLAENKKIYTYSIIALLGNIVFFLVYRIDYWFVKYYCSASQMGNYVQVNKMGQMLLIVPQIIASAVFPQTSSGYDLASTRENVLIISRLLSALYVVLIIVSAIVGKWIFPFVFGPTFNYMYLPFVILLPGIWALSVLALLAAYFAGKGNVKINVYGGLVSVVVMIIGNFIFLPRGGGIAAAAAISTVAYFLYMLYLVRKFNREYEIKMSAFLIPSKHDVLWLKGFLQKNKIAL